MGLPACAHSLKISDGTEILVRYRGGPGFRAETTLALLLKTAPPNKDTGPSAKFQGLDLGEPNRDFLPPGVC